MKPLQKDIAPAPALLSEKRTPSPAVEVKEAEKTTPLADTKQEEVKANDFNSDLRQIESIQSFNCFDQHVRNQGQGSVSFDWTQQQEEQEQDLGQQQRQQKQQQPPIQSAGSLPYGSRNYHEFDEPSSYIPPMASNDCGGYYDQYPHPHHDNHLHHFNQQQYHQQYPMHLEQPPIMMNMNHYQFQGNYYQMQGGSESNYYQEYNIQRGGGGGEDSYSNGSGSGVGTCNSSSKNNNITHNNIKSTNSMDSKTNNDNPPITNTNINTIRNNNCNYDQDQKYGPDYGRPRYFYDEYQYQMQHHPPKVVTPMIIPPGASSSSSCTNTNVNVNTAILQKHQQQQQYPIASASVEFYTNVYGNDESRNENSSGTTSITICSSSHPAAIGMRGDYNASFDSNSQRDQYLH